MGGSHHQSKFGGCGIVVLNIHSFQFVTWLQVTTCLKSHKTYSAPPPLPTISHCPAKFGVHRHCSYGDITLRICPETTRSKFRNVENFFLKNLRRKMMKVKWLTNQPEHISTGLNVDMIIVCTVHVKSKKLFYNLWSEWLYWRYSRSSDIFYRGNIIDRVGFFSKVSLLNVAGNEFLCNHILMIKYYFPGVGYI